MKVATLQQLLNCCWCPNWCCSTGAAERKHLLGPWIRKRRWKQKTSGSRRILVTSRPAASIHCTTSTIPAVRMRRFIVFSLLLSAYSGRADATVRFSETHPANASSSIAEELDAEADSPRGYRRPPPHHPPPPSKRQRRYPYSDFLSQVLEPFFRPEGGSPFYDGYGIDPYYYPPHPNDHYIEPAPPIHHSIRHPPQYPVPFRGVLPPHPPLPPPPPRHHSPHHIKFPGESHSQQQSFRPNRNHQRGSFAYFILSQSNEKKPITNARFT